MKPDTPGTSTHLGEPLDLQVSGPVAFISFSGAGLTDLITTDKPHTAFGD